ncbi:MAG: AMP-binding enzyme, partial [Candidatus Dormibacteria bacterium]
CRLAAVYGPTENTTFSTWFEIPMKSVLGRSVPIGRPIAHSSAYVVDERLELLPLGAVGQLAVGGDGVALGYLNAPERTAERFVPDPFSGRGRLYLTGDLARCRADGVIEFFGRRDHQVKVRGFRIELGEIEAALQRERAVRDVAVVVAENGREKSLVAFVVAAAGEALDGARLRAALAETLPPYMLPHRIEFLAELPLHPSGKTDRVALAARATSDERARVQAVAGSELAAFDPSDLRAVRALVANEWRSILRADGELSHEANFFDAGGDSLRLLALHARLARFAPALRVVDLFEHVTIRAQAEFIAEAHRATACAR